MLYLSSDGVTTRLIPSPQNQFWASAAVSSLGSEESQWSGAQCQLTVAVELNTDGRDQHLPPPLPLLPQPPHLSDQGGGDEKNNKTSPGETSQ